MPEAKSKSERRVFTDEFKRDAVRLTNERGNVSQVARDLGIHESVLTRWRKRLEAAPERPFPGQGNPQDLEMAKLKRENARFQEENEILKRLWVSSLPARGEIPVHSRVRRALPTLGLVPDDAGLPQWLHGLA